MTRLDQQAICLILKAQHVSELAKQAYSYKARTAYYARKDAYIRRAVELVRGQKRSRIRFRVEVAPDQNGYRSNVFYFEFNMKGKHFQFSFHNPKADVPPMGDPTIAWDGAKGACVERRKWIAKHS